MRQQIAVVNILTGIVRYVGHSESAAAERLDPGTTFGKGDWTEQAIEKAQNQARWHRENGYVPTQAAPKRTHVRLRAWHPVDGYAVPKEPAEPVRSNPI